MGESGQFVDSSRGRVTKSKYEKEVLHDRLGLVSEATAATAALATGCARLPVQALLRHRRNGLASQGTLDQNRRATKLSGGKRRCTD